MTRSEKTLAMRLLEGQGIPYQAIVFPESIHDALGVAAHAGLPPEMVYKTLVVEVTERGDRMLPGRPKPLLILVAAPRSLDLRKAAAGLGVKKIAMARQDDAERWTGLQVGGISALALLNRGFTIYLDEEAIALDEFVVSAGKRGLNLRMRVEDFLRVTGAVWLDASTPA
jgi:Cys-tRNA(Pro)/Cys-tRNA(Cys) deacylase